MLSAIPCASVLTSSALTPIILKFIAVVSTALCNSKESSLVVPNSFLIPSAYVKALNSPAPISATIATMAPIGFANIALANPKAALAASLSEITICGIAFIKPIT